jgi:hypothetical protein
VIARRSGCFRYTYGEAEMARVLASGRDLLIPDLEYAIARADHVDGADELIPIADRDGAVLAEVDDVPCVVVRVAAPWCVIDGLGARAARGCLALISDSLVHTGSDWDALPRCRGNMLVAENDVWHGTTWTLRPHRLLQHPPSRDWPWGWGGGSWGPAILRVYVERSRAELDAYLATWAPSPFVRTGDGEFVIEPVHQELHLRDGQLELQRGYHQADEAGTAFEAGLLHAIVRGALGELQWDLYEDDYVTYLATGETAASLADYLSPAVAEADLRAYWDARLATHVCDATAATTHAEVIAALAASLGTPTGVDFDDWLVRAPHADLPRAVEIRLPATLGTEWLFRRVTRRTRIRWMASPR